MDNKVSIDPALQELIEKVPGTEEVEVVLRLHNFQELPPGVRIISQFGDIATGRVRVDQIREARTHKSVASMKAARWLTWEPPVEFQTEGNNTELNFAPLQNDPFRVPREFTGKNIVVAALDWGIDFASNAFRKVEDGKTRFLAIWDQSALMHSDKPNCYGYGVIYLSEDINSALEKDNPYAALGYHPAKGDPLQIGAHGTHTFDIAAGSRRVNGTFGEVQGVAPDAYLVFVHLGTNDTSGLLNLGDSVRLLEAFDFVAKTAGERPWVVNTSLGSHGGPHDGKSLVERGIDNLLSAAPGRAVCMSTGNYRQAQIHTHGRLIPGNKYVFTWIIDPADVTLNELEVWYPGRDTFSVSAVLPDGSQTFSAFLGERTSVILNGLEIGRIYNRKNDPNNHDNHIDIFLYQNAPAGHWNVILYGEDVVDGRFHVWIERDRGDPHNQSRLYESDATKDYTIGSICSGDRTIAVGAFDSRSPHRELALFSSCGPTRDGRQKPTILAPGVKILAARSTPAGVLVPTNLLVANSGASMAAPYVTGSVALVFQAAAPRKLWIFETQRIMLSSAEKILSDGSKSCFGEGYLNIDSAIDEALRIEGKRPTTAILDNRQQMYSSITETMAPPSIVMTSGIIDQDSVLANEETSQLNEALVNASNNNNNNNNNNNSDQNTRASNLIDEVTEEQKTERANRRNFILVSGGPGPYDNRDPEHDQSWANYVTPPLLMTEGPKLKEFAEDDEEVWWFVYEPAYTRRWEEDLKNPKRKKEIERVKGKGFSSYARLIENRAKDRNWHLVWLHDSDDFWKKLRTFNDKISRLWYWGHARDDLWLSLRHAADSTPIAPEVGEIITIDQINSNKTLKEKFQYGDKSRTHRFIGCNTSEFAKEWAKTFGVWTEGIAGKIDFVDIHATGGAPALVKGAKRMFFSPEGEKPSGAETLMENSRDIDDSYSSEIDENFESSEVYDPKDYAEGIKRWFGGYTPTSENQVTALIDGEEAYESMVQAMRMASKKGDYIYLANWNMKLNFRLIPTDKDSTLMKILDKANRNNVEIRALLSDDVLYEDPQDKNLTFLHHIFFNNIIASNGSFIPDRNFLPLGIHHQKILIVKAGGRLIGFCGGVDYDPNRLKPENRFDESKSSGISNPSSSLKESGDEPKSLGSIHDVHCKIEGPAAWDLLQVFVNRWNDHPQKPMRNSSLSGENEKRPTGTGKMFVRIGTTFGCGMKANQRKAEMRAGIRRAQGRVSRWAVLSPPALLAINHYIDGKLDLQKRDFSVEIRSGNTGKPWYDFAKNGDTSAWSILLNAIKNAKKYIYIEDQYLTSLFVANTLNAQLSMNRDLRIIILIPDSRITPDLMTPFVFRGRFIKALTGNKKYPHPQVQIYYRDVNKPHNYVHAKTWIFDDEFAVIGSANCGDRSLTHDSEVVAGIYDPGYEELTGSMRIYPSFAKILRQRLWAHHLNLALRDVADLNQALSLWERDPASSFVKRVPISDVIEDDDNLRYNLKGAVGAATGQVDPRGDCSS